MHVLTYLRGLYAIQAMCRHVEAAWRSLTPALEACAVIPPSDFPNYDASAEAPERTQGVLDRGHSRSMPTGLVEFHKKKKFVTRQNVPQGRMLTFTL